VPGLRAQLAPSDLDDLAAGSGDRDSLARSHGFADWHALVAAVEWRDALSSCDLARIGALLAERPELAVAPLEHWCDHPRGASPLGYIAMLRFDAERLGLPQDIQGTGAVARTLLAAGARVNGDPGDSETPLITAASYGDADVARVLIEAGADIDAVAADDAGGVPGGTALLHAGVFGMTDVVDVLVASGARVQGIVEAAAAGDVTGFLTDETPLDSRVRALTMAAGHDRVAVIEALLEAGTPVNAVDAWGSTALQAATENGRTASVAALAAAGAIS
jgi:ankyrin repeat protein